MSEPLQTGVPNHWQNLRPAGSGKKNYKNPKNQKTVKCLQVIAIPIGVPVPVNVIETNIFLLN